MGPFRTLGADKVEGEVLVESSDAVFFLWYEGPESSAWTSLESLFISQLVWDIGSGCCSINSKLFYSLKKSAQNGTLTDSFKKGTRNRTAPGTDHGWTDGSNNQF